MRQRSGSRLAARTQLAFRRTGRRIALRPWVPYSLLLLGIALTWLSTQFITATENARAEATVLTEAERTRAHIQERLNTYIEVIRAANALLSASSEINHAEFRAFVASLRLADRYPGLQGIGFAQRLAERERRSFLRLARLDGIPGLRIRPSGERLEYSTVLFLEPRRTQPQSAVGLDMYTDAVLREAMIRARDTGEPAATTRLPPHHALATDGDTPTVLYTAVYRVGRPTLTVEQRRQALVGFVFSPFKMDEFLNGLAVSVPPSVSIEVRDGPVSEAEVPQLPASDEGGGGYTSAGALQVGGREWQVVTRSRAARGNGLTPTAQATLTSGVLLSLLLFAVTRIQIRAWQTADDYAAELAASEEALLAGETRLREMIKLERDARTQAQAADQAKDEFLATLSHELRTPLNAVLGWLHMLRNGNVREDRQPYALEVIERNARRQAQLIEDLLDMSRIILGKVRVERQPVVMAQLVARTVDSFRPGAHAKGVTLHADDLTNATIQADPARFEQIIWNLLSNAIKFTPPGGHVFIEMIAEEAWVQLAVRDTGVGIEPAFLPHLFERFRQADSSTTRLHSGVGLGLSIARHLVELHGGSIQARSDGVGRGALFVLRFPRAQPVAASAPPAGMSGAWSGALVGDEGAVARGMPTAAM